MGRIQLIEGFHQLKLKGVGKERRRNRNPLDFIVGNNLNQYAVFYFGYYTFISFVHLRFLNNIQFFFVVIHFYVFFINFITNIYYL